MSGRIFMEFKANFVVFDLETGGLSHENNPVLEVAMFVLKSNLENGDEYDTLVKPYGNLTIQKEALYSNGIDLDVVNNIGKTVDVVVNDLCKFLQNQKVGREKPILVGHNIDKFDIPFLDAMFTFCKKDLSNYVNSDFTIDTMWWSRIRWQESVNYKLGTCIQNAGIELVNAHRAVADTRATRELVKKFLMGLRSDGSTVSKEKKFRETFEF